MHFEYFKEIGHHLLDIVNEIIPFVLTKDNRSKKVKKKPSESRKIETLKCMIAL